jgi:hypothetical protein
MIVHNCVQGTAEWHALRLGIPTASNFSKIITPAKCELSEQRHAYMYQLVAETLTGVPSDSFVGTEHMERGKEREPDAARAYEAMFDVSTGVEGFVTTDDGMAGASIDRLVFGAGGALVGAVEIKCPAAQTMIAYFANGFGRDKPAAPGKSDESAAKHKCQIQGQLYIRELDWIDGFAYHPNFPYAHARYHRDDDFITKLRNALRQFNDERLALLERLRQTGIDFGKAKAVQTPHEAAYDPHRELDDIMEGYGTGNIRAG